MKVIQIIMRAISICCVLVFTFMQTHAFASDLSHRLNIPEKGKPYRINAVINNHRIHLLLPEQKEQLNLYPDHVAINIKQRLLYRNGNIDIMSQLARDIETLMEAHQFMQPTEYSRQLTEVVMSVFSSGKANENPLMRHAPLLRSLPQYTRVNLIVPKDARDEVWREIQRIDMEDRVTLHEVTPWHLVENGVELLHNTTRWAQDLFETAYDENGLLYIFAPATRYQINDLARSDNRYLKKLENTTRRVVYVPLFFRGGNILVGKKGQRVLFIGERELRNNRNDFYNSLFAFPNNDEVLALFRRMTGTDRVVIVKNSRALFHIDMAMTFIADGQAALIKPIDENRMNAEDADVLESIEAALTENGFTITYIPTTVDRITNYQSPVNTVLYKRPDTGSTEALVPRFDDTLIDKGISLNALIEKEYEQAGIRPIFIEDRFHAVQGNFHCAVSVLE